LYIRSYIKTRDRIPEHYDHLNDYIFRKVKERKLVTLDGWGFVAFPEAGIIASHVSSKMQYLAAIDDGKTRNVLRAGYEMDKHRR